MHFTFQHSVKRSNGCYRRVQGHFSVARPTHRRWGPKLQRPNLVCLEAD